MIAWRPFTARGVAAEKADHQFREDPFRNKSHAFSGRVVSDAFRRQRLDKYLNEVRDRHLRYHAARGLTQLARCAFSLAFFFFFFCPL